MVELDYIVFFSLLTLLNSFLIYKYRLIAKIYNLYDLPNEKRKIHKSKVPLVGGLIIVINLIIFISFEFFIISEVYLSDTDYLINLDLNSKKTIASFIFCLVLFFLLGYFDDKYDLDPLKKLTVLLFIFYIFFKFDNSLIINELNLTFVGYPIEISEVGLFLTLFLTLLFLNSINMYDGINGQVGLLSLNIFFYFFLNNFMPMFAMLLIVSLIFFLILNLKGKIFMGDSGCYILSFIFVYFFLKYYTLGLIKLDQIFLLFFLPIVDALRLFITRIFNSGKPWKADSDHFHHLISKKYSLNFALLSQYFFSLSLIIFITLTEVSNYILIFIALFIYLISLTFLKKTIK
jgi:UDP-N-acetylmuramyl pentapeptide phosphotransferase/UDP-N-acetylglucosamine-1-phosphate transferase